MVPDPDGGFYAIPDDPACDHEAVHHVPQSGVNRYFRCPDCETVLVRAGGPEPDGPTDDLGTVDPRMGDLLEDIDAYHGDGTTSYVPERRSLRDRLADALRGLFR